LKLHDGGSDGNVVQVNANDEARSEAK
jgi:hypothetical protein